MKRRIAIALSVLMLFTVGLLSGGAAAYAQDGEDVSDHFHTTVTSSHDTYTTGETAIIAIKYTIDGGSVSAGDYVIITIPENIIDNVHFSYSKQHFSSLEELGNGKYKFVFAEGADTALCGSMSVRMKIRTDETADGKITAGDSEIQVTALPQGGGQAGTGIFEDEAIMKDGLGNDGMSFGGYDYFDEQSTQIGIFDATQDNEFMYRIFANRKNVSMENVTLTDTLPDGMYFVGGTESIICYKINPSTMGRTDTIVEPESVTIDGQKLTVRLGDIDYPVEIDYTVSVPAQTSVYLRNCAEIKYVQDGEIYKEHQDYIAQSEDYSAVNGVKSVDKTQITTEMADQWVTYTIRFWNENRFAKGEINLDDQLDPYIDYLFMDDSEYFEIKQDSDDDHLLHITNAKAIPASTEVSISFVCSFIRVPEGYTVLNTVGGNTTKTTKVESEDPTEPEGPIGPAEPTGQTDSTDPTDGTEPTDQADSTDPTDGTEPTDQADSTDLTDITEPTDQTDSADPADQTVATLPTDQAISTTAEKTIEKTDNSAETGDKADLVWLIALLILSAAAICILGTSKHFRNKDK